MTTSDKQPTIDQYPAKLDEEVKMLYSAKAIANYFLALAEAEREALTPIKLQKLIYYAVGWHAAETGRSLIDEPVEAWQFGTVVPTILYEFIEFGDAPITGKAVEVVDCADVREVSPPQDAQVRELLDRVWNTYSRFTDLYLSRISLVEGSPWDQTRRSAPGMRSIDIPLPCIAEYFRSNELLTSEAV